MSVNIEGVKRVLDTIAYRQPRLTGVTAALIEAAIKNKGLLVCTTSGLAKELRTLNDKELDTVTIAELENTIKDNKGRPFFYDNATINNICMQALNSIHELEKENEKLRNSLKKASDKTSTYE